MIVRGIPVQLVLFSRGHDPITQVRRATFLTYVGDLPLSVSCHHVMCPPNVSSHRFIESVLAPPSHQFLRLVRGMSVSRSVPWRFLACARTCLRTLGNEGHKQCKHSSQTFGGLSKVVTGLRPLPSVILSRKTLCPQTSTSTSTKKPKRVGRCLPEMRAAVSRRLYLEAQV